MNSLDKRYIQLKIGLEQLSNEELERILSYDKEMCLDRFNYDEEKGLF